MKRILTLAIALVFTTGMAFAQANQATVTQTGNGSDAAITQTGQAQTSTVEQIGGNDNAATVIQNAEASSYGPGAQTSSILQNGSENQANVNMQQTGGGGKGLNTAVIEQIGDRNKVLSQSLNAPGSNSGQHAKAYQTGNDNTATQEIQNGYTQSMRVDQIGDLNTSVQTVGGGSYNTVEVYQDGNENQAAQTVNGNNWGYSSAVAKIDQQGGGNNATQDMLGGGSNDLNNGQITQAGDDNQAVQMLKIAGTAVGGDDGNDGYITQTGNGNYASQSATGYLHQARTTQLGNDNRAEMTMTDGANGAHATFTQEGDLNVARLLQEGGDTFTLMQDGNSNLLKGIGGDTAYQTGGSTATVDQIGDSNMLSLHQELGASATVTSTGNGNTASVDQR